jgi:hypothetical protein
MVLPSPSPSKTPLNVGQVAAETDLVLTRVRNLLSKPLYSSYNETEPVFACVIVYIGSESCYYPLTTHYLKEAETYLSNAYSLADKQRLPNETTPRVVGTSEYAKQIESALKSLSLQKDKIRETKANALAWIRVLTVFGLRRKITWGTSAQSTRQA